MTDGYGFLIKLRTSGCSDAAPTYKQYREEGEKEPYMTEDLTELAIKYEELLNTYPRERIQPFHFLTVNLNTTISEDTTSEG